MVEMLRMVFESRGFVVSSGHIAAIKRGGLDLGAFLAQHRPDVVIYDLAPPYEQSWNLLEKLRSDGPLRGHKLLLTTTNTRRVEDLLQIHDAFEVVGKPYDLDAIVNGVQKLIDGGPPAP